MPKKIFHESLKELQTELKKTKFIDKVKKDFSDSLLDHVQTVLEHPGEVPFLHHYNLMNRLKEAMLHFESTHPNLTELVVRVTDSLNRMGI
jgi:hypothetical protein